MASTPRLTPNLLGQRLIARGAIGAADLERALDLQPNVGGRIGIYELVPVDEDMQQAVVNGATHAELRNMARAQGVRFLRQDGLIKAWQGVTSVEEVLRVTAL